jgi:hypothetical protein
VDARSIDPSSPFMIAGSRSIQSADSTQKQARESMILTMTGMPPVSAGEAPLSEPIEVAQVQPEVPSGGG